ncbi:alanine racemase [Rickettsiales bacterium]|nr:alanine racemase [Rickettsiales bacterium]
MLENKESLNDLGIVSINLDSLKHNYKVIKKTLNNKTRVAAVLKANAYGLGIEKIATTLEESGCELYFVATLKEGIELRKLIKKSKILVLNGSQIYIKKIFQEFKKYRLIPVINSHNELNLWTGLFKKKNDKITVALHFDTGMNRLGIPYSDLSKIKKSIQNNKINIFCIMSHLASADDEQNITNKIQKKLFDKIITNFPNTLNSLANSSATFNLKNYGYSFVRTGGGLFGINPNKQNKNLKNVVSVKARILQIRNLEKEPIKSIGYNSTYSVRSSLRIAVLGIGYADGYPRNLSNNGYGVFKGKKLPIVGNISMDYMTVDISCINNTEINVGDWVELIGEEITIQKVAKLSETIEYEILNNLGYRLQKDYISSKK